MNATAISMFFLMGATAMITCLAATTLLPKKKPRRKRSWWVRPIYQKRREQGDYHNSVAEMSLYDTEMFFHYTRMTIAQFDDLLSKVGPQLLKKSNRAPLQPGERLAVTLRYLATGSSTQTLAFQFRIGKSTVSSVIKETCSAMWDNLHNEVFLKPSKENWLKISNEFFQRWQFPHCIGAIDGKHFRIQCPPNTGSEFFNYKKYFSLLLLAMCDANYCFTIVNVGGMGAESDGGLFQRTFGKLFEEKRLDVPEASRIGIDIFLILWLLMRPFL